MNDKVGYYDLFAQPSPLLHMGKQKHIVNPLVKPVNRHLPLFLCFKGVGLPSGVFDEGGKSDVLVIGLQEVDMGMKAMLMGTAKAGVVTCGPIV